MTNRGQNQANITKKNQIKIWHHMTPHHLAIVRGKKRAEKIQPN
jgi:hypothetical protein